MTMEEHLTKDQRKALRQEEWKKQLQKEQQGKRMSKILWWVGGAALLAFSVWFLVVVVNSSNSQSVSTDTSIKVPGVTSKDISEGPTNAKVVMVEYADFQCPGCGAAYPTLNKLESEYKDKMLFVYRYFPLTQIHKNAIASAKASYAAYLQGKFWPMHDQLFANQQTWAESDNPTTYYDQYAQALGLDMIKYHKDFNDPATEKIVKDSEQASLNLGLSGTPTIFINGQQVMGFNPLNGYNDLKKIIDEQLKK